MLAGLLFVLPKIGPLKMVDVKGPTQATEAAYVHSLILSAAELRRSLARFTPPSATRPAGANLVARPATTAEANQALVNPTLKAAYVAAGGRFVDVTAATGAYVPLSTTVRLPPYGRIPAAVASVCRLSYYCSAGNIHLHTGGYTLMGRLITARLAAKQ